MERTLNGISRIYGLDLSKKTFTGCCLTGEDFSRKSFFNGSMTHDGREKLASRLGKGDIVAMEGGTSTATLARYLMENTEAVIVVLNPGKLHVIFESMCKTDRQDAGKLAVYLRDTNPEAWCTISVPTQEESENRAIVTSSIFITQSRVQLINRLHALFNQSGHPELKKSDLKQKESREDFVETLLSGNMQKIARLLCDSIELAEKQLEVLEGEMQMICAMNPDAACSWLSLPGIGIKTAATLIAFTGDLSRFVSADQLRNYVGLVPKKDQSGTLDKKLGVRWCGCMPIRRNIIQGGWSVMFSKMDCSLTHYSHLLHKRGKIGQKAAVAIANKLLNIGFAVVKSKEIYEFEGNAEYVQKKLKSYGLASVWQECTTIPATESNTKTLR